MRLNRISRILRIKRIAGVDYDDNPCSILATASQYVDKWYDDEYRDNSGRGYLQPVKSWAFKFDGTTNVVGTPFYVSGQTPIFFGTLIKTYTIGTQQAFISCGAQTASIKGITYGISISGEVQMFISSGSVIQIINTGRFLAQNTIYYISIEWSGLTNGIVYLNINGSTTQHTATTSWTGNSGVLLRVAAFSNGTSKFRGTVMYADIEINNAGRSLLPLSVGNGSTIYDVDYHIAYTISGTVTSANWVKQDVYHYNILNGFNKIGNSYIPASRVNAGHDVLGNVLSNPAVQGHNGAETLLKQGDDTVKLIDTHNEWFDIAGNAIEHSYSTLPVNGTRVFGLDSTNYRGKLLTFDHDLSTRDKNRILLCLSNNGDISLLTNESGQYLTDENGIYLTI